ncbi:MAG: ABC transporter substrate-binding protein, partial [Clostridium sp.]|nr:ABC transporter substrate-binding protein [Clostridium sp.]
MKRKILSVILTACLGMTLLSGCGSTAKAGSDKGESGKTEVTFWHSMGGSGGEAIEEMVDKFN